MRTIGVDLSAEQTRTWMATLEWRAGSASLVALESLVGNTRIVEATRDAAKVGIDCPFGWPVPFVQFVQEHQAGDVAARAGLPIEWRRTLAYRRTDLFVTGHTGQRPLSVAADRIAHPAMRCAALLAELAAAGEAVDRTGLAGKAVEVYPAASLRIWGLTDRGYKRAANLANLDALVSQLLAAAPWLRLGEFERACRDSDDAFDAVVAALTARATACGLTVSPPPGDLDRAAVEGWIALPVTDSLDQLVGAGTAGPR